MIEKAGLCLKQNIRCWIEMEMWLELALIVKSSILLIRNNDSRGDLGLDALIGFV